MRIVVAHDSLGTEGGVETYLLVGDAGAAQPRASDRAPVSSAECGARRASLRARTSPWASRSEASTRP